MQVEGSKMDAAANVLGFERGGKLVAVDPQAFEIQQDDEQMARVADILADHRTGRVSPGSSRRF